MQHRVTLIELKGCRQLEGFAIDIVAETLKDVAYLTRCRQPLGSARPMVRYNVQCLCKGLFASTLCKGGGSRPLCVVTCHAYVLVLLWSPVKRASFVVLVPTRARGIINSLSYPGTYLPPLISFCCALPPIRRPLVPFPDHFPDHGLPYGCETA